MKLLWSLDLGHEMLENRGWIDCLDSLKVVIHYKIEVFQWYISNTQLDEIQRMKSKNICENALQDVPEKWPKNRYIIPIWKL